MRKFADKLLNKKGFVAWIRRKRPVIILLWQQLTALLQAEPFTANTHRQTTATSHKNIVQLGEWVYYIYVQVSVYWRLVKYVRDEVTEAITAW